nr:MAG TPA: hypothetical protein [Caudoviricetes sp.]
MYLTDLCPRWPMPGAWPQKARTGERAMSLSIMEDLYAGVLFGCRYWKRAGHRESSWRRS